jgi:hypothetical protein
MVTRNVTSVTLEVETAVLHLQRWKFCLYTHVGRTSLRNFWITVRKIHCIIMLSAALKKGARHFFENFKLLPEDRISRFV